MKNLNSFHKPYYYFNFCFYKYNEINKNLFNKKPNIKKLYFKSKSLKRDKNLTILNKYFNNCVYNGKKESFFNTFNNFIILFLYIFVKKNNYFVKFFNYENVFKLISLKNIYYDFNFLIKEFIFNYNSIFDLKIIKVPKKYKLKLKKKFDFELVYMYKNKRLKFTLKLLNNFLKKSNNFNLKNKLFWVFVELIFDPQNSFLWKRKINIYNKAMKKFFKKL